MEQYETLQKNIYGSIDELYMEAVSVQEIWMMKVARKELSLSANDYREGQGTKYELRIDISGPSFILKWLSCDFHRNGKKIVRVARSISIPRNGKYTIANFKDASKWELDLILEMENHLAPIRNQTKHLMKCHFSLGWAVTASGNQMETSKIKDRVTAPTVSIKHYKEKFK